MNLYFVRHGSAGSPKPHPQEDAARGLDREARIWRSNTGSRLAHGGYAK